ncbi:TPA: nucleoside triphosphatase NudI [Salmonella enterica subsp. enterica serovar Newport]|nr:nucleoside triphosphatase NudI [Salmonella enterica]
MVSSSARSTLPRVKKRQKAHKLIHFNVDHFACFCGSLCVRRFTDGRQEEIYMIYLIFDCVSANRDICINDEFQDYAWVKPEELALYDLNVATRHTLALKGLL